MKQYLLIICSFFSIIIYGQEEQKFVEIEVQLYKPKRAIKKVLKEISSNPKCFEADNDDFSNKQQLFIFVYHPNDNHYILGTTSAANVVTESLVEWDDLIISGIVKYKGATIFLTFNRDETNKTKSYFKKCGGKIKESFLITNSPPNTYCGANFQIKKNKFKLLDKFESWDLFND